MTTTVETAPPTAVERVRQLLAGETSYFDSETRHYIRWELGKIGTYGMLNAARAKYDGKDPQNVKAQKMLTALAPALLARATSALEQAKQIQALVDKGFDKMVTVETDPALQKVVQSGDYQDVTAPASFDESEEEEVEEEEED